MWKRKPPKPKPPPQDEYYDKLMRVAEKISAKPELKTQGETRVYFEDGNVYIYENNLLVCFLPEEHYQVLLKHVKENDND